MGGDHVCSDVNGHRKKETQKREQQVLVVSRKNTRGLCTLRLAVIAELSVGGAGTRILHDDSHVYGRTRNERLSLRGPDPEDRGMRLWLHSFLLDQLVRYR